MLLFIIFRSRHRRCSAKKGAVLKKFAIFTGKYLCWSLFSMNVQALGPASLLKGTPTRSFPVKFLKFLRTPILKNNCEQLLLYFYYNSHQHYHHHHFHYNCKTTAQKMKFSVKDFSSKRDQIRIYWINS